MPSPSTVEEQKETVSATVGVKQLNGVYIQLEDKHIYSVEERPPSSSPLVHNIRHNEYFKDIESTTLLANEITFTSSLISSSCDCIELIESEYLSNLSHGIIIRHGRIHSSILNTLHLTMLSANAILEDQGSIFHYVISNQATSALVKLTRADDLAHRIIIACNTAIFNIDLLKFFNLSSRSSNNQHVSFHSDNGCDKEKDFISSTSSSEHSNKRRFSTGNVEVHSKDTKIGMSKRRIRMLKTESELSQEDGHSIARTIPILGNLYDETKEFNRRLIEAKNEASKRLQIYKQSHDEVKEKYDTILKILSDYANKHQAVSKNEREEAKRSFMVSSGLTIANFSCCMLCEELMESLNKMKKMRKESQLKAQQMKWKLMSEKSNLRKILNIYGKELSYYSNQMIQERERVQTYNQKSQASKGALITMEKNDHNQNSLVILNSISKSIDKLRANGSQIAALILNLCNNCDKHDDNLNYHDEISNIAVLLLRFYGGWAAVADFCGECIYHVNGQRQDVPKHETILSTASNKREVRDDGNSSDDNDGIYLCSQRLDALTQLMKSESWFSE